MKLLLIVSLALFLDTSFASMFDFYLPLTKVKDYHPCGNWEPYLNGKCFKLLAQVDNYRSAETLCAAEDKEARVLSNPSPKEYSIIETYTRTKLPFNHAIWLNGWSPIGLFPAKGGDTARLSFNNACLFISVPKRFPRGWEIGSCADVKHIICEKRERPRVGQLRVPLTEENLSEMKEKEKESLEYKIASLENKLEAFESKLNGTSFPSSPPRSGAIDDSSRLICVVIILCLAMLIILGTRQEKMIQQLADSKADSDLKDGPVEETGLSFSSDCQEIRLLPV